eukprot:SAG22_NODE_66_length_22936_cov_626.714279_14_plen_63_part_00
MHVAAQTPRARARAVAEDELRRRRMGSASKEYKTALETVERLERLERLDPNEKHGDSRDLTT